jgi:predicted acyltransferase
MDPKSQATPVAVNPKPAQAGGPERAAAKPARAASSGAPVGRVASIDALRGFDMFWIVGGNQVVVAVVALFGAVLPASWLAAASPYFPSVAWFRHQMSHVPWEGFTSWDLIMPLFLFIVGAAMPFSFAQRFQKGQSKAVLYRKIFRRVVILWILGMIAQGNLLNFEYAKLHLFSNTLQAIAIGYLVAALALLHLSVSLQVVLCALLLVGYWLLMLFVPVPGHGAGILEGGVNLARYIDEIILRGFRDGTTYTWILSGMAFAGTTLLGVFSGHVLRTAWRPWTKVGVLAVIGGLLLTLAWLWSGGFDGIHGVTLVGAWRCPIIKHLFTSSMVLWACGWSFLLLALFYLVIDVLGYRRWSFFFMVIGANAIFAYMVADTIAGGIYTIARELVGGMAKYLATFSSPGPEAAHTLVVLTGFAIFWLILLYMYRKGTFLRV